MNKKKTSIAISLFLMFAMVVSIVAIPAATAQEAPTRKTYAIIMATPNPVGVGQETLIMAGITQQLSLAHMVWEGLSITIKKPDGTTETIRDIRTDSTGATGRVFVPTMAGEHILQSHFPEQMTTANKVSPGTPEGTRMLASSSRELTLVVTQEPIPHYPPHPLPTEYWTRPIDAQHREWATLAGNWIMPPENLYARFNDAAPETAHILWTKPIALGGLAGGLIGRDDGAHAFECGDAYEPKFEYSVIIGGILYYNRFASPERGGNVQQGVHAVDLYTGEEIWFRNNTRVAFGQTLYWDSFNYHGVYGYLWEHESQSRTQTAAGTYRVYCAFTGEWVYTMTGVPSGTNVIGTSGEILRYTVNTAQGWMTLWNSSKVVNPQNYIETHNQPFWDGSWARVFGWTASEFGRVFPAERGIQWNVSIPTGLPGTAWMAFVDDRVIGTSITATEVVSWGLSLEPNDEGRLLFRENWAAPSEWAAGNLTISRGAISAQDGVFTLRAKETRVRYGFSTDTGKYLWAADPLPDLDYLMGGMGGEAGAIAEGKFFSGTMSGILHCYNAKTGELLWTYEANDPYNEVLWSNYWPIAYQFITDGKIYVAHTEHSPIDPKPRGAPFICIDIETGEEIWRADGLFRSTVWGGRAIIGRSIIVTMDTYDQRIYAIGKGPSATNVAASPKVSVHGSSVLVEGTVIDISAGTKQHEQASRFPNGVPAVADESMSEWMLYVYKNFPRPADAVGVEVVISVLDPNNNYYEVGRTTADADGFFRLSFEPLVPGDYTVVAEFEGSKSYWPSQAKTAISVQESPDAPSEPTPPPESIADVYLVPGIVGIIVAIAIVGAVIVLMLRKR